MPKFDGTGPRGMGPRTGCCNGPCKGCMGCCGCGMNCCGCPCMESSGKTDQKKCLNEYLKYLEEEIKKVKQALGELSKKS